MTDAPSSAPGEVAAARRAWDADIPLAEVKRLRPVDRGARARASLARKVELLERWGRDGLPPQAAQTVPWDRAKLRRWRDPAHLLWVWVDPQVDAADGRNAALMQRYRLALQALEARRKDRGLDLRRQVEALTITNASLERQNMRLLDQIRHLQTKAGVRPVGRS